MDGSWKDWQDKYNHLTLHIVPGPRSWTYFLPFLLTPVVLMVSPSVLPTPYIRTLVLPVLISIQICDWIQYQSFDVISMNNVLMMFMLLGWYDVRNDFKHVLRQSGGKQHHLDPYPQAFGPRLQWIGLLLGSLRLTDWYIGLASHDKRQPAMVKPFQPYLLATISHALVSYIVLAQTGSTTICSDQFSLVFLARLYAILALYNSLLPTLIVLCIIAPLGLQQNSLISPLTWHSHFGSFASIYERPKGFGLRAFWGIFWHQNMRYLTSTPGIALAYLLGLSGRTRYMLIVYASFFWSGVVHMGVIPAEPLNGSAMLLRLQLACFFWFQPLGIIVEILLESYWTSTSRRTSKTEPRKDGKNSLSRSVLIIFWTYGFLAVTANFTIRPVGCQMGWWSTPFLSVPRLR